MFGATAHDEDGPARSLPNALEVEEETQRAILAAVCGSTPSRNAAPAH
jgi:hypothetical protein